jgi:hypothetical protein
MFHVEQFGPSRFRRELFHVKQFSAGAQKVGQWPAKTLGESH